MAHPGDELLHDLEERMERSDPRFARGLDAGRPRPPREYRRRLAWVLLAVSVSMLVGGLVLPQGLLLATGLVVAGVAAHLFAVRRGSAGHRPRRP